MRPSPRWLLPIWGMWAALACAPGAEGAGSGGGEGADDTSSGDGGDGGGGGDGGDGGGPSVGGLVQGGVRTCADPGLRDSEGPLDFAKLSEDDPEDAVVGIAVADFNGDDWPDLFLPGGGVHRVLLNDGTGALVATPASDWPAASGVGWSVSTVDVDGDGDLDVFVGGRVGPDQLLQNDGSGGFVDVTAAAGLPVDDAWMTEASAWADLDGDGDLDLVRGTNFDHSLEGPPDPGNPNEVFLNDGGGQFSAVDGAFETDQRDAYTRALVVLDANEDGANDVLLVNHFEFHHRSYMTLNSGTPGPAMLVDDAEASGLGIYVAGMGASVGDLNGDGRPDLMLSGWQELPLLESLDDQSWYRSDLTRGLGLLEQGERVVAWGSAFVDLDLNGELDAPVAFGHIPDENESNGPNPEDQPDGLWLQQGGQFVQAAEEWGFADPAPVRGLAVGDFDQDGYPDLMTRGRSLSARLFRNRCGQGNWLTVRLSNPDSPNTWGVGARISVAAGGVERHGWIQAGGQSYASVHEMVAHFGLGDAETVDELVVHWPDGERSVFEDIPARQRVVVSR